MKFECKNCGYCCSHFGKKGYLPVLSWEKDLMVEEAKVRGIEVEFVPIELVFDKKSRTAVCTEFGLMGEPCCFLKDNKCSIYDKRPLVCRSYPLAKSVLSGKHQFDATAFCNCQNLDVQKLLTEHFGLEKGSSAVKISDVLKKYVSAFDYEPLVSVTKKAVLGNIFRPIIHDIVRRGLAEFEVVDKDDYGKYEPVSLLDFLIQINVLKEEDKQKVFSEVVNGDEVRKMIDRILEAD